MSRNQSSWLKWLCYVHSMIYNQKLRKLSLALMLFRKKFPIVQTESLHNYPVIFTNFSNVYILTGFGHIILWTTNNITALYPITPQTIKSNVSLKTIDTIFSDSPYGILLLEPEPYCNNVVLNRKQGQKSLWQREPSELCSSFLCSQLRQMSCNCIVWYRSN